MALFHFDNNKDITINAQLKPSESIGENSNTEFKNTVWEDEFEDDLGIGDRVTLTGDNKSKNTNTDENGREWIEHITHNPFKEFTEEDWENFKNPETKDNVIEKYKNKIKEDLKKYNNYDERFPEGKYEVEVVFDGKSFVSYVYKKEYETITKSNPYLLQKSVDDFINGNFDVINNIKNPVEFLEAYRKKSGGKTMYSAMISAYKDGKLSSGKMVGYLNTLQNKFSNFELDYDEYDPTSKFGSSASAFSGGYYPLYKRVRQYFERERDLEAKYKSNAVDREQVKDIQKFIKENFDIELNEIAAAKMLEDCGRFTVSYNSSKIIDFIKNISLEIDIDMIKQYRKKGDTFSEDEYKIDSEIASQIKQILKERTNFDITNNEAGFIYDLYKWKGEEKHFDIEKLKADCINGEDIAFGSECRDYLENILTYAGNAYNDSLELLEEVAQNVEIEYGRYNFDIHKSPVADLAKKSETMIKDGEKELSVTKTNDKIVIRNKSTGKERIIDLTMLTSKLDEEHKQLLLNALDEFNKISLWEFAKEATKNVEISTSGYLTLAQYSIETDNISIGNKVDSNTLLHEMIHAMMATVIDGKNTSNEPLFKEFVEAFEEEQRIHHDEKRLRNTILAFGNYTYCAENIFEFAAEAGCLWLSGKSDSEFTIATHFPKSYRLFVQLIEKIRSQETGRSMNG